MSNESKELAAKAKSFDSKKQLICCWIMPCTF